MTSEVLHYSIQLGRVLVAEQCRVVVKVAVGSTREARCIQAHLPGKIMENIHQWLNPNRLLLHQCSFHMVNIVI